MFHRTRQQASTVIGQAAAETASPLRVSHSYYAVFIDYGRRGLEAIVDPEVTRRGIVDRIRTGEYKNISFIHHVDGLYVYDCTAELMHDAGVMEEV